MKHFLGLPSLCFFTTFLQFLSTFYGKVAFWKGAGRSGSKIWQEKEQQKPGKKRKLSMLEEFVMIMMKLRLGLDNLTLSVLFGVSVGHVSILFNTWIVLKSGSICLCHLNLNTPKPPLLLTVLKYLSKSQRTVLLDQVHGATINPTTLSKHLLLFSQMVHLLLFQSCGVGI